MQEGYGAGSHERKRKPATEREAIKEFDFFPVRRGDSELADRTVGNASSSSSSASASPGVLDLSLKLSF